MAKILKFEKAKLSFDVKGFVTEYSLRLAMLMEKYVAKFIEIFQKNIVEATSLGPGKPEWREDVKGFIEEQSLTIANGIIEYEVGFPGDLKSSYKALFVKVMLIMYGSGSNSVFGGSPIRRGPVGRSVWDSNLDGKVKSKQPDGLLPATWNHIGNNALEKSIKEMEKFFDDLLDEVARTTDSSFFQQFIHSSMS